MPNKAGSIRPQTWRSGPDPLVHRKYQPYLVMRSQAAYRGEAFELTFQDFCDFWTDERWELRGRKTNELTLTRRDPNQAWSVENCVIMTRKEQLNISNKRKHELYRQKKLGNNK